MFRNGIMWTVSSICVLALAGCSPATMTNTQIATIMLSPSSTPLPASATATATVTVTSSLTPTPTITPTATPDNHLKPRDWAAWPVVPQVSMRAKEIYLQGVKLGITPRTFSVVGDCQSEPEVFLGIYATDRYYLSSDYQYLQETINYFQSSFSHKSVLVRDGLSAPSALSPLWADPQVCRSDENPVQCELRLYKPMIVFINLGTVWREGASADKYEEYLRQIVELVIASGPVPILSTKADNVEGDHSINLATARVAYDYDIPLWNFWTAADHLPNHDLDPERNDIYLTPDAWDVRNFVALKTLDAIWRELKEVYDPGN